MKDSLLGYTLLKDLFLRHDVQVGKRCIQQVEVCVFIHSPVGESAHGEPDRNAKAKKLFEWVRNNVLRKQKC